ncbi:hypothetical protein N7539_007982 [Penicillium diatomitis]|uniref:Uncharacterized protein n=1 Tax=Penicillium diatomitis TaxID=2819901 RepID=A0A9W9WUF1_9EURO|nr:uncharacterized protein N7539_007982 [Penicillium diatomitis]KAJ5475695.1 hypothetical protein N7539_007982 [Penicillium diatomitis]
MGAAIPPITGMLRRGLVLDLSTAFAQFGNAHLHTEITYWKTLYNRKRPTNLRPRNLGFGTTFGYLWWYESHYLFHPGYHLPRVRERDTFYARLEQERAAQRS